MTDPLRAPGVMPAIILRIGVFVACMAMAIAA